MFDISWGELMLIGVVALIFIGPKELPGVLRMVGQWVTKIRRMAGEFQSQFQEAMREAEMADLKKQVDELNDTARGLSSEFNPLDFDKPASKPTESASPASSSPTSSAQASSAATSSEVAKVPTDAQTAAPASSPDVSIPLPDPPAPVTEKDFATTAPEPSAPAVAPKEAGGGGRA